MTECWSVPYDSDQIDAMRAVCGGDIEFDLDVRGGLWVSWPDNTATKCTGYEMLAVSPGAVAAYLYERRDK